MCKTMWKTFKKSDLKRRIKAIYEVMLKERGKDVNKRSKWPHKKRICGRITPYVEKLSLVINVSPLTKYLKSKTFRIFSTYPQCNNKSINNNK